METFIHEVPASPVCPAYKMLAVRQGWHTCPVMIYEGRQCYVSNTVRTRVKKGWGFFNMHVVRFLDDGTSTHVPSARFHKAAKHAPLP